MFSVVKQQNTLSPYLTKLVADTKDDISKLPTHYAPGSSCLVTADSSLYILNNSKEWVLQTSGSSGGGGSGIDTTLYWEIL